MVLLGANGTGKTSVLEALSLLAPGRGLRRARLADILRTSGPGTADSWLVQARIVVDSTPSDITAAYAGTAAETRERRQISIDGEPVRDRRHLAETVAIIWLTPEMERLFGESPSARRRFLDRLVWGVDPAHARRVGAYERALQQRSALLRQDRPDPAWLDAVEATMAEHAVAIAAARKQAVAQLSLIAAEQRGDFPAATVAARGSVEDWLDDVPALGAEDRLRAELSALRIADARTGGAAVGPHRSDLRVFHGASGRPAELCSTGEQKMLLIALVLAGARLQHRERGTPPLLLLDEVIAHLDERHRVAIFAAITAMAAQAWYAGCDRTPFRPLRDAQIVPLDATPLTPLSRDGDCRREEPSDA